VALKEERNMRIPDQFQIFGQTITVKFVQDLTDKTDLVGGYSNRHNIIKLQTNTNGCQRQLTQIEETFFHELVHNIYQAMGEKKLSENETHVGLFASLLHQALSTAVYLEEERGLEFVETK